MAERTEPQKRIADILQIGGLAIGVVAVLVTAFFSIRAERTKEITVRYLAKRPLVSLEGGPRSVALEISLGGSRLEAPWLLSGRIENTGNQPVEERDIEAPARIAFSRGKIVRAEIVQKSQAALFANAMVQGNGVVLEHKLLNPGDWINFDVLFDGEPDTPSLSFRISGIPQPKEVMISPDQRRAHPALVPLPLPVMYLLLSLGSAVGIASTIAGLVVFGKVARDVVRRPPERSAIRHSGPFHEPQWLLQQVVPKSRDAQIVKAAIQSEPTLEWLDQPNVLEGIIKERVAPALLESLALSVDRAATMLSMELREGFKAQLANALHRMLPAGPDRAARDEMLQVDAKSMRASELLERAAALAGGAGILTGAARRVDPEALATAFVLLVIGVSLVMLLGGTWRTLLGV